VSVLHVGLRSFRLHPLVPKVMKINAGCPTCRFYTWVFDLPVSPVSSLGVPHVSVYVGLGSFCLHSVMPEVVKKSALLRLQVRLVPESERPVLLEVDAPPRWFFSRAHGATKTPHPHRCPAGEAPQVICPYLWPMEIEK